MGCLRSKILSLMVFLCWTSGPLFGQKINPRLDWLDLETRYFVFTYPRGLDGEVVRLSSEADAIYEDLQSRYRAPFKGRISVVLQGDVQSANGYFTILPYPHLMLYITPWTHRITESIDDEIRILFTHELTHYLTLNHISGPLSPVVKLLANRANFAGLLPFCFVEGVAILEESGTGYGRLNDPIFKQSLAESVGSGPKAKPIIEVECNTATYPYGRKPYLFGGGFLDYLSREHGRKKINRFYNEAFGHLPYFYPNLFKKVFGVSLSKSWKSFQDEVRRSELAPAKESAGLVWMTQTGARKSSLKFRSGALYFFHADHKGSPSLWRLDPATQRQQKVYENSGLTDYDVLGERMAIVVQERTRYEVRKRVAIRDVRTGKKRFAKGTVGVHSVGFKNDDALYMVRYEGMRSEVLLYDLELERGEVFLAEDDDWLYGNLATSESFVAVEARSRTKPYRTELWVFDHAKQKQLRINSMKRAIYPAFERFSSGGRLLFSALEEQQGLYSVYAYDFNSSSVSVVAQSSSHLLSPAVGAFDASGSVRASLELATNTYALVAGDSGYDVALLSPKPSVVSRHAFEAFSPPPEAATASSAPVAAPWGRVRPRYRVGLNHLNLYSDVAAYRFEWVEAPLLLRNLTLDAGVYYGSWAPFFKLAYTSEAQKNHVWQARIDRLYRFGVFGMDRVSLAHKLAFNRNQFFFSMDESLSAGYLLNLRDEDSGKPTPNKAWNPFLRKHEQSWRYLLSERVRFGLYQKKYIDLVPYKAAFAELGAMLYTSQYWQGDPKTFLNAAAKGFRRVLPWTTLSASVKTIYSLGGAFMNADGLPIAVRLMTNISHENIQYRTQDPLKNLGRGLLSAEFGLHQKVVHFRWGQAYYFPFYLQSLWFSGYFKAGRVYDFEEPERTSPVFRELVGQATLEVTFFYHVRQYIHYFAFVDPANAASFRHLISFQFQLPI